MINLPPSPPSLSMDDFAPHSPMGSPPTSNASSPRPPSPIGSLDSEYGEDGSYMPPLSLDDLSHTPSSSNSSIEHSYSPLDPSDFKKLRVISEIPQWPCKLNNDMVRIDIPSGTILDIIGNIIAGHIFRCNFTYNGTLHSTVIPKSMLSEISPKIEYLTNSVGGYKRRSIKRRKSKSRKSKSRKGRSRKGRKSRK